MEKHVIRLKEIMIEKNISRDMIAKAMNVVPATITNISTGKVYPSVKFLIEVSEYLDVDIREMFISTKGGVITTSEVNSLRQLFIDGLKIIG